MTEEDGKLTSRYELHRFEVVQVHPTYGRRALITADGHGQLVWVGEIAGSLLILDQWRCMGDKDGSLHVLDPETLETKATITLDLDAVGCMGFDEASRFVLCESSAGRTTWRAWRLTDWAAVEVVEPVERADLQDLKDKLTCMVDLPRVPPKASRDSV
jgi:WD40 repeat protein